MNQMCLGTPCMTKNDYFFTLALAAIAPVGFLGLKSVF